MKGRHVDDVVKPASTRLQGSLEISECQTDLSLEVRLGRAVAATADLTDTNRRSSDLIAAE